MLISHRAFFITEINKNNLFMYKYNNSKIFIYF